MGLPSTAIKPYIGMPHYIGREGHKEEVDEYRDVVGRSRLSGGGFWRLHEKLQNVMKDIMTKAGITISIHIPTSSMG